MNIDLDIYINAFIYPEIIAAQKLFVKFLLQPKLDQVDESRLKGQTVYEGIDPRERRGCF